MRPFWEVAIEPILAATRARRVVEIGALRGEMTNMLLERLGPDAELHVIDPLPAFDPSEHRARFPGRYIFHRDLSLNVLPGLPPMDAALIDGDHNWYTVYNELKLLAATAREADRPMPVMLMHDVEFPYGRRDLYYDPDTIPEEFRQPFARRGIRRGRSQLLRSGGMNSTLDNALREGGPRNGVATGLDDFLAEHDRPVRRIVLPFCFGLAIVVEEERLAAEPALAAVLDALAPAGRHLEMLHRAEEARLAAVEAHHTLAFAPPPDEGRAARRYLELLKGALLDEHYLENEARLAYLLACTQRSTAPDIDLLRDPARGLRREMARLRATRRAGRLPRDGSDRIPSYPYTTMGRVRLDHLERCLDEIRTARIA